MQRRSVVVGQRVERVKLERSRELRRNMTPEETVLWQALRGRRLGGLRFRRQQVIDGYIADFYCDGAGLVVEVDGPVHEQQVDYDRERDQAMRARGLALIRVSNDEVRSDLAGVLCRVAAAAEGTCG